MQIVFKRKSTNFHAKIGNWKTSIQGFLSEFLMDSTSEIDSLTRRRKSKWKKRRWTFIFASLRLGNVINTSSIRGKFTQPFFHTFWDFSGVIFKHCTEWLQWSWRSYSVITTRLTRFSIFWHLQKSGWEMEALFCRQAANKSQENEGIQFLSSRRTIENQICLWLNFSILRSKLCTEFPKNELFCSFWNISR